MATRLALVQESPGSTPGPRAQYTNRKAIMTRKKQLVFYTSMFSSIFCLVSYRFSDQTVLKTVGNARAPISSLANDNKVQFSAVQDEVWIRRLNVAPTTTSTSTTTTSTTTTSTSTSTTMPPATTTTTVAEAPRIASVASQSTYGCVGHKMSVSEAHACWDGLLATKSWPVDEAFNILYCESTADSSAYDPISVSGHHAEGLMQVLDGSTDPQTNIDEAYAIWLRDNGTFKEWAC